MECQEYLEEWIGDAVDQESDAACVAAMTDEASVIDDAMEL